MEQFEFEFGRRRQTMTGYFSVTKDGLITVEVDGVRKPAQIGNLPLHVIRDMLAREIVAGSRGERVSL
jgi:hypothetical protein